MAKASKLGHLTGGGKYTKVRCVCCKRDFNLPCEARHYPFKYVHYHKHQYFCGYSCKRKWDAEHVRRANIYLDYLA